MEICGNPVEKALKSWRMSNYLNKQTNLGRLSLISCKRSYKLPSGSEHLQGICLVKILVEEEQLQVTVQSS